MVFKLLVVEDFTMSYIFIYFYFSLNESLVIKSPNALIENEYVYNFNLINLILHLSYSGYSEYNILQ